MKINYEFATNESTDIEVSEEIGQVILEFEKSERNKNRAETRRHSSIENYGNLGGQFADKTVDIENDVVCSLENETLYIAIEQLLPQQKELLKKVFFENVSMTEIARQEGVSKAAINDRFQKIYKKIKKLL